MSISEIFGKPREGSHSYRLPIIDLAAVDVILTGVGAYGISYATGYNFWIIFIGLMILSIPVHMLFGVRTALIDKLF